MVLKDITLNVRNRNYLRPLKEWTVVKQVDNRLELRTEHPASSWTFEWNHDNIIFSATTADLFLSAKAPASSDRVVARLIDPAGVPVNWRGTEEITVSWNGQDTQNPSFLPSRNPEVMTFALGQVSSSNLHSLFDRKMDIALNFSDQTTMSRNIQDHDLLDLVIPVPAAPYCD
ncbi:MAG: hypothetical protein IPJ37_01700 [Bacteroidales bacterium]|nr:hypothetical protein [Bacteroidales bacterium]